MTERTDGNWAMTCTLRDWETMRTQLLFAFDNPIPGGTANGAFERHGEYSAWLVRKGTATLACDGEERTVGPGQWLLCMGRRIYQTLSPDIHLLSLRMAGGWPNGDFLFNGPPLHVFDATDQPHLEPLAMQLLTDVGHVAARPEPPSYTFLWRHRLNYLDQCRYQRHQLEWLEAIGRILHAIGMTIQIPSGVDPRLAAALLVIDNLSSRAPYPTDELAQLGGPTIGQLNRLCLKTYGQTMYGYWEQRRLERAKLLLGSRGSSVKETAYQLGFSQLSHFSVWFKRHTSQTPRAFQASYKLEV